MIDLADFIGIGVATIGFILHQCIILPAAFPQLVGDIEKLIGLIVAAIVRQQLLLAHGTRGAIEITGDDVPAEAPFGQMIERRKAARERIWRFITQVGGDAKTQMLRYAGHAGNQHQRIVHRQLNRLFGGQANALLIDVIHAENIGDKQPIKQPALQQARQIQPVIQ